MKDNKSHDEKNGPKVHIDPLENTGVTENYGRSSKHNVSIGGHPDVTNVSVMKTSKQKENNVFQFLQAGVYKAGIDTLTQSRISLKPDDKYESDLFSEAILKLQASLLKLCTGFEKDKTNRSNKYDQYKRALEIAEEVSYMLRTYYDCNFITDHTYCAITVKLSKYMTQLKAICSTLSNKFKNKK
jgi:hypothetical protein